MKPGKEKGYGLVTLMCAVIGTVIGSGIFFKSEEILNITDGNVFWGLLIFASGGGVMLLCSAAFAVLSTEVGSGGGVVGYAEKMCGKGFAIFVALFSADFYLPSMTATLAYVSGRYFCELIGEGESEMMRIAVSGAFLVAFFAANTLTPRGARNFQVVSTVLKLLPLLVVGTIGCAAIFGEGGIVFDATPMDGGFMAAVLSSAFAYEGWIAVTALGRETENPRKNMPLALIVGSATVLAVYIFYYFGVIGASGGSTLEAFENILGVGGGKLMLAFVTVSCLGALNGLTMSVVRGHYLLSEYLETDRRRGLFGEISEKTGIPVLSGVMGLLVSEIWLVYRVAFFDRGVNLDPAEASISVMYLVYIPIFVMMAIKLKNLSGSKRYILPFFAVLASAFVAVAAPVAFGYSMLIFLLPVATVSGAILFIYRR